MAPLLAALLVVASVATPAAAAVTADRTETQEAYAGTHVSYDVQDDAVVDYTVDNETMVESMRVESQSNYESRADVSGEFDLETVVELDGLGLEMGASSTTQATVQTEGSASIVAHDNEDGTLVVHGGENGQFVEAQVSSDAEAAAASDDRVVVETGNGTTGTFIVVGDGNVTVNEAGNVTAELGSDASLVFRESGEERTDGEERVERMIANGTATAEVYVEQQDGETVEDTVTYGQDTTVEAAQESEHTVNMTVERSQSQGKVVVTHVSDAVVEAGDSVDVMVDGEAAAQAESTSELRAATQDGDESMYYVAEDASAQAEASTTVMVAFNHFSERTASIQGEETTDGTDGTDGDDSDGTDGDDSDDSGSGMPGFGVTTALAALVGAAFVAVRARS